MVKGFKQTEVGVIPCEWEVKLLKQICEMKSGSSITEKNLSDIDAYPCYGGNGLRGYTSRYTHEGNFSLIGRQGALCGNVQFVSGKFFASEHAVVVTSKQHTDIEWLSYVLARMNLNQYSESSAQPGLSVAKILYLPVAFPTDKAEQTAIAIALNDANTLIQQLKQLIAKKRNIKTGAMQELLRPKEGWEIKKLGEIGECIIGLTYNPSNVTKDGILVLRSSNIKGNRLAYEDNVFVNVEVSERLKARKGDILICVRNGSRNLIGKCAYIEGRAIGETFGAFMSVFRSPLNDYVFHVLQSYHIQRQIEETIGATINQLTNKNLNSFEIPFPTPEEQTRIAQILSDMDNEIQELEKQLQKYKMQKQGMMQNLLTGKIRLI